MTQEQIQQFFGELSDQELRDFIKGLAGEDPEVGGKLCGYAITQRDDSDTENIEFSVDCVFGRLDLLKGRKKDCG